MTSPQTPYPYDGLMTFSPKLESFSIPRQRVSQHGFGLFGLEITGKNGPVEVDDIWCDILLDTDFDPTTTEDSLAEEPEGRPLATFYGDDVKSEGNGRYSVTLGPTLTAERGFLTARWQYVVEGELVEHTTHGVISEPMPTYDRLRPEAQATVRLVEVMFADLFDSTDGGPWLQENFQTHFSAERIAQIFPMAMNRINITGLPITSYGLMVGQQYPTQVFDSLLSMGLYLEVLRHLIRSYTEQPEFRNMSNTFTDRRDYAQRWRAILDEEKPLYEKAIKGVKRTLLGLGGGALLVSGGVYGGNGYFRSGAYAMATRSMRMYPYPISIVRM